jgi:hypothetical protein
MLVPARLMVFAAVRFRFDPLVILNRFDCVEIAMVPAPSDRKIVVPAPLGDAVRFMLPT